MFDRWWFSTSRGPIVVERVAGPTDAKMRAESSSILGDLVRAFARGEAEARRVVFAMHARQTGEILRHGRSERHWFDIGPNGAEAFAVRVVDRLAWRGTLARQHGHESVVLPIDATAESVLGPDSSRDAAPVSTSWIGLVLLDQTGAPVPNRPYHVVQPDGTAIDGRLDSNGTAIVKNVPAGNCQLTCPVVTPHAETTYVVADGDHISGIAQSFGFDDYTIVWNDPNNAGLAAQRADPHVLLPGDSLYIPELKATPVANKPTSAKHTFTMQLSPLKLRLVILDVMAKPMASAPVSVAGTSLSTDGNGLVEATVDKSATDVPVETGNGDIDVDVAALNPDDDTTDAGWKARLYNMGFLWDPTVDDGDDEMLIALQDFQEQYSLPLSGQLDDATKAQLTQSYGS